MIENPYNEPDPDQKGVDWDLRHSGPVVSVVEFDWKDFYRWAPHLHVQEGLNGPEKLVGRKSDMAQAILYHLGKPLRLNHHAFMLPIYDSDFNWIVMKCGRQTSKSTTICCIQTIESIITPHWRSLYVSPSALQTRQYSNEKLRPTVYDSPFVVQNFIDRNVIDQVFERTLKNGSYMFLRYAFLTPARARGIPASRVFFDEAQDLLKDNIKIISQSLSASRLAAGVTGRELIAGTPLTFSNTLEEYWRWSTQCEWLVPCERHTPTYHNMLDASNIGKTCLICSKCGKPIDPARGQWVQMQPKEMYQGFHITQLMVPWKQDPDAWRTEIVLPMERWPAAKFHNEILGLSYDSASAPVTRIDIEECCYPKKKHPTIDSSKLLYNRAPAHGAMRVFAGVDWGEGRQEGEIQGGRRHYASWTVLTLGGYINSDDFWIFSVRRYVGKDISPEVIVPDILHWFGVFNVECIGCDWGHGWGVNSRLLTKLGRERVMQFNYSSTLGERKRWDPEAYKWIINRNSVLANTFQTIKEAKFIFPEWTVFEPFAKDVLAEYVEYNEAQRTMKYDHPIDQPDDFLHSLTYCKLTADIMLNRF